MKRFSDIEVSCRVSVLDRMTFPAWYNWLLLGKYPIIYKSEGLWKFLIILLKVIFTIHNRKVTRVSGVGWLGMRN